MTLGPQRIACLSTETVDVLYRLGAEERIAGISGFTVYPPRARKEKPKISGFSTAHLDKILAVEPDLVLTYSNLQADIACELIKVGVPVHAFNQKSVAGIFDMVRTLGALVDAPKQAADLMAEMSATIADVQAQAAQLKKRPTVYFEEWHEPLISGIRWATELIELAGGVDAFPEFSQAILAKHRIIADPLDVVRRRPDIMIASWCGRKFAPEQVPTRPGWEAFSALPHMHEIKSAIILTPGPVAILEGLPLLAQIFKDWAE